MNLLKLIWNLLVGIASVILGIVGACILIPVVLGIFTAIGMILWVVAVAAVFIIVAGAIFFIIFGLLAGD